MIGEYGEFQVMVMWLLGRLPGTGAIAIRENRRFEVIDPDGKRIDKVLATQLQEPAPGTTVEVERQVIPQDRDLATNEFSTEFSMKRVVLFLATNLAIVLVLGIVANKNYYVFKELDVWNVAGHTEETWPKGYALFYTPARDNENFSDAVTIMAYMHFHEVEQWKDTFNTVAKESTRGESYEAFKKEKAEKLLNIVYDRFPELKDAIDEYYVSTPLTLRDYVGSDDGSLYGITKDFRDPMKTFISARSKIPNLLLTGHNLNLHGVLGVTVSGVLTSSQLVGGDYLIEKIRNA